MARYCTCRIPRDPINPRQAGKGRCRCGLLLNPDWTSNDHTVSRFYSGLARSIFPAGAEIPDAFQTFQIEAEAREYAGREQFGHRSLARDNLRDAREEASDGSNYLLFDHLRTVRDEGRDDDMALVLTGAKHFYLAYSAAIDLRHRRGGQP